MSDVISAAVAALNEKLGGNGVEGTVKFVINGEGEIIVDANGAREGSADEDAEVTLSADKDTFEDILSGDLNPTSAFMTGKLSVDGDMGKAMQLGSALS